MGLLLQAELAERLAAILPLLDTEVLNFPF